MTNDGETGEQNTRTNTNTAEQANVARNGDLNRSGDGGLGARQTMQLVHRYNDGTVVDNEGYRLIPSPNNVYMQDPRQLYVPIRQLGSGSYANVFECISPISGLVVAVKIIQLHGRQDELTSFRKEISILEDCATCPYIVHFYEAYQFQDEIWIVMENCEGGSLESAMNKMEHGCFTEDQAAAILKMILQGLYQLHSHKKIHRDIKPANILFNSHGEFKLADFGLSAILERTLDSAKSLCGTPYFVAPEICRAQPYDKACDVWSLGILAYYLLVGAVPPAIRPLTPQQLMTAIPELTQAALALPGKPDNHRWSRDSEQLMQRIPNLNPGQGWSLAAQDFLHCCFHKDVTKRWDVEQLLMHEFIFQVPRAQILTPLTAELCSLMDTVDPSVVESRPGPAISDIILPPSLLPVQRTPVPQPDATAAAPTTTTTTTPTETTTTTTTPTTTTTTTTHTDMSDSMQDDQAVGSSPVPSQTTVSPVPSPPARAQEVNEIQEVTRDVQQMSVSPPIVAPIPFVPPPTPPVSPSMSNLNAEHILLSADSDGPAVTITYARPVPPDHQAWPTHSLYQAVSKNYRIFRWFDDDGFGAAHYMSLTVVQPFLALLAIETKTQRYPILPTNRPVSKIISEWDRRPIGSIISYIYDGYMAENMKSPQHEKLGKLAALANSASEWSKREQARRARKLQEEAASRAVIAGDTTSSGTPPSNQ